jgi:hypothetical protein
MAAPFRIPWTSSLKTVPPKKRAADLHSIGGTMRWGISIWLFDHSERLKNESKIIDHKALLGERNFDESHLPQFEFIVQLASERRVSSRRNQDPRNFNPQN